MAGKSFPFVSISGDRKITASDEAAGFAIIGSSGVAIGHENALEVTAVSGEMAVSVASGGAIIEGRRYVQDDAEQVMLEVGEAQPRIDIIAVESNLNTPVRAVRLVVVKGTAAASPVSPALTQTESIQQLALARVLVPASASTLASATITDARTYVKGNHEHTSASIAGLQSALDSKQSIITGGVSTVTEENFVSSRVPVSNGDGKIVSSSVTSSELATLSGVTGNIQTQLNGKQATLASDRQRKITISTSNPSGGSDGDVWFVY